MARKNQLPDTKRPGPQRAQSAEGKLSGFAQSLMSEWKRLGLPLNGERALVAVSGGADSTALLLALDELLKRGRLNLHLIVAHLDHGLRGEDGAEDARWVEETARRLKLEVELGRAAVKGLAERSRDNLEQAARRARYEFLAAAALQHSARLVLTGHTMDDQAETILMRLLRGSGAEGLSGMSTARRLTENADVLLIRPLLAWARRTETESYCRARGVSFRVDAMNADERFARVRLRRRLMPLLETFNPKAVESLSRAAELLREDSLFLNAAAEELLKSAAAGGEAPDAIKPSVTLDVNVLACAPVAMRRRALRLWIRRERGDLRRLELSHLLGVEKLLAGERGGRVAELPGGASVERRRGRLRLRLEKQKAKA